MSAITLRNRQRVRRINAPLLRRIVTAVLEEVAGDGKHELCIHLVAAPEMARINQQYLQHDGSTDVITFDYAEGYEKPHDDLSTSVTLSPRRTSGEKTVERGISTSTSSPRSSPPSFVRRRGSRLHGEIFICLNDAIAQARQFRIRWQSELTRYVVHGILHLFGHDDLKPTARRKMKAEENRVLRSLTARFPLSQLARKSKMRS